MINEKDKENCISVYENGDIWATIKRIPNGYLVTMCSSINHITTQTLSMLMLAEIVAEKFMEDNKIV